MTKKALVYEIFFLNFTLFQKSWKKILDYKVLQNDFVEFG